MKLIKNTSVEPYFNMAAEEYLLNTVREPCAMLWRNSAAVVVGKNQNVREQVNLDYTREHNIAVVRRLTGGGAVFHDLGNINYTFVTPDGSKKLDFAGFSEPVIRALASFGVTARLSGRNDLVVACVNNANGNTASGNAASIKATETAVSNKTDADNTASVNNASGNAACERKISGSAQCVYEADGIKKVLHHGTLLYSADMSSLVGSLNVDPEKIKSKGIKSVRSRVINLRDIPGFTEPGLSVEDFYDRLCDILGEATEFSPEEKLEIERLSREKYRTDEWIYGKFAETATKTVKKHFSFGTVSVDIDTNMGIIKSIDFSGDFFGARDIHSLEESLKGADAAKADEIIESIGEYIHGATPEDILPLIINAMNC